MPVNKDLTHTTASRIDNQNDKHTMHLKRIAGRSLITLMLALSLSAVSSAQYEVVIDRIDGISPDGELKESVPVRIYFRFVTSDSIRSFTNGIKIYAPFGVEFTPPTGVVESGVVTQWWESGIFVNTFADGLGEDTIGFGGFTINAGGLPPGTDSAVFAVETKLTRSSNLINEFCIDQSFYPPSGYWTWVVGPPDRSVSPIWNGPYCFDVVECCIGIRGNVDGDNQELINVSDLTYFIEFLFRDGSEPGCFDEADVITASGDGLNISDLTFLIDYLFRGGPPPPQCP